MRIDDVMRAVHDAGLDALLVLTPANTYYVSGFRAITYSRPVMVVLSDDPVLIIPELELSHAAERSVIPRIRTYSDMALGGLSGKSTFQLAADLCVETMRDGGLRGRQVGFEATGITADGLAYLSTAWDSPLLPVTGTIERLRMLKDPTELYLIRAGAELAELGMRVEIEASAPGTPEIEIMARGNAAMLLESARAHPELNVTAGSRPVSGEKTVLPHSIPSGKRLAPGDIVIHGTGCVTNGYYSEDERTIFVGEPTVEQRRVFDIMLRAQLAAIAAIRPGRPCRDVDRAARDVIDQEGYGAAFIHRTGHGMGLDVHEPPFFSASDETTIAPGMVMSVEPGIYLPGVGGFRHSDTIFVTEDGCEVVTQYPKTLPEVIVT
ncbi:MAG TPA: Xaa-Pro peptidase family protein [bacterium]|jgi:Xaa-Pro dipeptidase|nr:Xaa-Pro peptidase family protein [bacterium]